MDRLTVKTTDTIHDNGAGCVHFGGLDCYNMAGHCSDGCPWEEKVWGRLAAYEDTALTPEEIQWAVDVNDCMGDFNIGRDRLRELAKADKEGRCVVLSPKQARSVDPAQEPECFYPPGAKWRYGFSSGDGDEPIEPCKRCWFLSTNDDLRDEAAEAALKERANNE